MQPLNELTRSISGVVGGKVIDVYSDIRNIVDSVSAWLTDENSRICRLVGARECNSWAWISTSAVNDLKILVNGQ